MNPQMTLRSDLLKQGGVWRVSGRDGCARPARMTDTRRQTHKGPESRQDLRSLLVQRDPPERLHRRPERRDGVAGQLAAYTHTNRALLGPDLGRRWAPGRESFSGRSRPTASRPWGHKATGLQRQSRGGMLRNGTVSPEVSLDEARGRCAVTPTHRRAGHHRRRGAVRRGRRASSSSSSA